MIFNKLKFNRKLNKEKSGLTMVETLVAISILTIAVIGPLGIIAQALHTSYYARDQITAYYLAQEAIEYVRNLRDNEGIKMTQQYINSQTVDSSWLTNVISDQQLNDFNSTTNKYSLIKPSGTYSFAPYDDSYLKISNGVIGDNSDANASTSVFKREIYFQKTSATNSPQEVVMTVNVYWKNGGDTAKLTLKEYLTDWASKNGL